MECRTSGSRNSPDEGAAVQGLRRDHSVVCGKMRHDLAQCDGWRIDQRDVIRIPRCDIRLNCAARFFETPDVRAQPGNCGRAGLLSAQRGSKEVLSRLDTQVCILHVANELPQLCTAHGLARQ